MALIVEREGPITLLKLNRPERMNAFDRQQYAEVNQALADFEADDEARVGIVTSTSPRAFSAGVDLEDLSRALGPERLRSDDLTGSFALSIGNEDAVTKPLIAAIDGHCVGEGFGLALYCDLRIAAETAKFSLPEAKVGITTVRVTIRLPQVIGLGNALELLMAGNRKDARWAERVGLVNAVVPPEELQAAALDMAREIAASSPLAVRNVKKLALRSLSVPPAEAIALGMEMRRRTPRTEYQEGTSAFLEKRKPQFPG